jgi:glycosyltransferase involved in cell wall biosynthesis
MKIALLSWESLHSVSVGGVAAHVSHLASALQRKGHEVHIFTRLGPQHHSWYEVIEGVHYHRCPYNGHQDFIEEINNMCRAFVESLFYTESVNGAFDVIHAHDWLAANALAWIKEGRGRKSILTIHSTEYGRCGNHFWGGGSERIRHIEWHGMYSADRVITVSNSLKGEVKWIYNVPDPKMNVIYNGVDSWKYDGWVDTMAVKKMHDIGSYDPVVLFVGRMTYQKGPDILVNAIPGILHHMPHAKFVFVGDGDMRYSVEQRAHQLGVHHATRFLGAVGGWKLKDLYKACDCVCVPSRNEPFGIVILESWSASKPVVATMSGGPTEIVCHNVNGYHVNHYPDSIGWGVQTMFNDFEHARWMGKNGRIAADSVFSWNHIADETLAVYSN